MAGKKSSKRKAKTFQAPRPHTVEGSTPTRLESQETPTKARRLRTQPTLSYGKDNEEKIKKDLATELQGHIFKDMPKLIEHVFPDDALPASVDIIFDKLATLDKPPYSQECQRWDGCPILTRASNHFGDQEIKLANWLNGLAGNIGEVVGKECKRVATGAYASNKNPLPGGPGHKRRPDVLIFNKDAPQTWETVVSHWELKNKRTHKKKAERAVAEGVRMIYVSQDDRRFIPSLSILGEHCILHILDRAGHVYSEMFNIHRDPRLFLRIFTAIMFSDREYLGYDPSITTLDDGSRIVTVKGKSYVIKKRIYFSPSILGRGTSCWQATRDGVTYAIKDYWTDVTREFTEAEFLEEARNAGIENVCQLVDEEILTFRGKEDTTDLVRPAIRAKKGKKKYPKQDCRVHRRLVLQPFAESIVEFETKRELIKAFIDVIQAHKALLEKVGILHRDISLNNIMLAATRDAAGQRRGVLIDLDYAMRYSEDEAEQGKQRKTATAERTGTTPFMALDLLWGGGGVSHRPEWDLESFFYVLFWICVLYDGPRNSERRISFKQTPLYHWTEGSFEEVAQNKSSVDSDKGWPNTLVRVSPYFEDLKPCLDRWRYILFKKGCPATHDEVVRILQETHDALEEEETPENAPGSVQGQSEKPISAVRQYHTRSYLETSKKKNQKEEASEDEVEEDSEDGSGKESEDDVGEEPEEDQVAEDDDVPDEDESSEAEEDSSDSSYSPSPSRARVQISSTGSRGRKRTRKDTAQEDDDDGYTESGIFPESQNAGWRSDAFTLHSPHPSSSASSWSQRTAPTSSEAKRHRGK